MTGNLPETKIVSMVLQQVLAEAGRKMLESELTKPSPSDAAAIDELSRILARCLVRDAMRVYKSELEGRIRFEARLIRGESPKAADILHRIATDLQMEARK